jgi:hypothetical protein
MSHSKIGASSMYRWQKCPGSVRLCDKIGHTRSSEYAEAGTRAHAIAADILSGKIRACPKGTDPDTIEAISCYTDVVFEGLKEEPGQIWVEQKFVLSELHPDLFGTADVVTYHPKSALLRIYDYKHGQGISVEVENNPQLLYYALGALYMVKGTIPVSEVEMVVVQPRCPHAAGPIRRWRVPAITLIDFAADLLEAVKRTEAKDAPLVPGEHCRFCAAAGMCPALHKNAITLAKEQFSPAAPFQSDKVAEVLAWLPTLESWIHAVREYAYREATRGRVPKGWKLVQKRARRKWKNEIAAAEQLLKSGLRETDIFVSALKSPAQIEKTVKAGVLEGLVVSESSGYTLVTEKDSRKSVKLDAKAEFEAIEQPTQGGVDLYE